MILNASAAGGEMALQRARERSSRICEVIIFFQNRGLLQEVKHRVNPLGHISEDKRMNLT